MTAKCWCDKLDLRVGKYHSNQPSSQIGGNRHEKERQQELRERQSLCSQRDAEDRDRRHVEGKHPLQGSSRRQQRCDDRGPQQRSPGLHQQRVTPSWTSTMRRSGQGYHSQIHIRLITQ